MLEVLTTLAPEFKQLCYFGGNEFGWWKNYIIYTIIFLMLLVSNVMWERILCETWNRNKMLEKTDSCNKWGWKKDNIYKVHIGKKIAAKECSQMKARNG